MRKLKSDSNVPLNGVNGRMPTRNVYRCSETPENDNKEISHIYILSLFVSEEYLAASHSKVPKTSLAAKAREDDCIRRLQINTNLQFILLYIVLISVFSLAESLQLILEISATYRLVIC